MASVAYERRSPGASVLYHVVQEHLETFRRQVRCTLKTKIEASIPMKELGRRITRREEDAILGYGPEGV